MEKLHKMNDEEFKKHFDDENQKALEKVENQAKDFQELLKR